MNLKLFFICIFAAVIQPICPAWTGLEKIAALKNELWNHPDTEWTNWMVVSTAPTRIYFESWPDEKRERFFNDFDPDHMDMWSGQAMNRGNFFRMRGTAVNSTMEYEYQELINPVYGHAEIFKNNGIARKEDGSIAERYFNSSTNPPCMCHNAPLWHTVVTQGMVRTGLYGDSMFQDNIANTIYTWSQGFCNWCNARFIAYMQDRFSRLELRRMNFDADTFHIRRYLAAKRREIGKALDSGGNQYFQEEYTSNTANERLIRDPIVREYIRFQHIAYMLYWIDAANKAKETAQKTGKPIPACYGNIPRVSGIRTFPTLMASQVDIVWTEESTDMQPCFRDDRQAWSALLYKTGRAASYHRRPVISCQYQGGHKSIYDDPGRKGLPTAIACSEALANGGILCQTWSATEFKYLMKQPGWEKIFYETNRLHAAFAAQNRALFTDRSSAAETALVYSFPSTFWREFQSLKVNMPHKDIFSAAARMLEDNHIPYEVMLLGHRDVFDDTFFFDRIHRYKTILIPSADCMSLEQEKRIEAWVKQGGTLLLLGQVGIYDEELNDRKKRAFAGLADAPGAGRVISLDDDTARALTFGADILPVSRDVPKDWSYTFEEPAGKWTQEFFDDSGWMHGKAPFGDRETRGTPVNTKWESEHIRLRGSFMLDEIPRNPIFYLQHWWDVQVFINGKPAAARTGRGYSFEPYQYLKMSHEAQQALRKGKNTIAVHCRQNSEHPTYGRFIDVGIRDLAADTEVVNAINMHAPPLIETDLPETVWLNVWRHGGGAMMSVQMVNYDVDLKNDRMNAVRGFRIRMKKQDSADFEYAWYYRNDFDGEMLSEPERLEVKNAGQYSEVRVPELSVMGVLVFASSEELEARSAAAETRKYLERLKIAMRCRGTGQTETHLIEEAGKLLSKIQGDVEIGDFDNLTVQLREIARRLRAEVEGCSSTVKAYQDGLTGEALAAGAVYKFDFGEDSAPEGWLPVTPETLYSAEKGYGWLESGPIECVNDARPDAVHGDFIRNTVPEVRYTEAEPPTYTGQFRIDCENGRYFVTVITGSYGVFPAVGTHNEGRCSMTFVRANGDLKLLGNTLTSGYFENKAFEVDVKDGSLLLEFYGENIGPLYANRIQWMVNGLLLEKMGQPATASASEYYRKHQMLEKAAVRDWLIAAPFEDPNCMKMEAGLFEKAKDDEGPEVKQIAEWKRYQHTGGGFPMVPLNQLVSKVHRVIGYAKTYVFSPEQQEAFLVGSFSQFGRVCLNGVEVYADDLACGLLAEEIKAKVTLREGWNEVMIKSANYWGRDWSFWLGLTSAEGEPINNITVSVDKTRKM